MKRQALAILGVASVHFALSVTALFASAATSFDRFDQPPTTQTASESMVSGVANLLSLPLGVLPAAMYGLPPNQNTVR